MMNEEEDCDGMATAAGGGNRFVGGARRTEGE